jgi:hypothetical protein
MRMQFNTRGDESSIWLDQEAVESGGLQGVCRAEGYGESKIAA